MKYIVVLLVLSVNSLFAQVKSVDSLDKKFLNWQNKSLTETSIVGVEVDKAFRDLLKGKKPKKTIVVAVIDGGVDIQHEDLKDRIWINEKEIPNNNIDDDKNGYVDDVNGWNFIGNKNGENIFYENTEFTRLYKQIDVNNSSQPLFQKVKQHYEKELAKRKAEQENIIKFEAAYRKAISIIKSQTGVDVVSVSDLSKVPSNDAQVINAVKFLQPRLSQGVDITFIEDYKKRTEEYLDKFLNLEFNPRSLVGDNPLDFNDSIYGNPDVKGPRSNHGTSVAGLIAAVRSNGIGIDGIADNVKIMAIRTTPMGDERDKDVAHAIKYAVENGANIINMSFGKELSPQKEMVDAAVRLAERRNVLIVHGSGNKGLNIDDEEMFPSDRYLDGSEASNWINVGASNFSLDENLVAAFSNFGKNHVDLFAPGENIISLDSTNTYSMNSGTSLSAPIVTGAAALILSYYPELTAKDLIQLLLSTAKKFEKQKVLQPNLENEKRQRVKFSELSKSGGILDLYEALKKAEQMNSGK